MQTEVEPRDAKTSDCDDADPKRSPALSDVCGDQIDNDCDGAIDDEKNNVCGGACTMQLVGRPGETCSNGLLGACAKMGTYQCQGSGAIACSAGSMSGTAEVCDGVDNDCDGEIDEGLHATWYRDCDGDGYAASVVAKYEGCFEPKLTRDCEAWTKIAPENLKTKDCDDADGLRYPNASFGLAPRSNGDRNCDGLVEHQYELVESIDPTFTASSPIVFCTNGKVSCNCLNPMALIIGFEGLGPDGTVIAESIMPFSPLDIHETPPPCAIEKDDLVAVRITKNVCGGENSDAILRHLCR